MKQETEDNIPESLLNSCHFNKAFNPKNSKLRMARYPYFTSDFISTSKNSSTKSITIRHLSIHTAICFWTGHNFSLYAILIEVCPAFLGGLAYKSLLLRIYLRTGR